MGYSTREVAKTLGLSCAQVRAYVRAGFLLPERGPRGAFRFSFQDLVLLRTARGLLTARIPARKVKRALRRLKDQLPSGRPLTGVQIAADGDGIVVHADGARWNPESGQALFNFEVSELALKVAPMVHRAAAQARTEERLSADDWYELACDLELSDPVQARDAYRRVVELDPHHAEAHVNLGRLLHEAGQPAAAEAHYRLALSAQPTDATAAFNLAVALEDLGRIEEAIAAYEQAIGADPDYADAHYNVARLYERIGRTAAALRHLRAYRKLTQGR